MQEDYWGCSAARGAGAILSKIEQTARARLFTSGVSQQNQG
jgi:hypothetical protein